MNPSDRAPSQAFTPKTAMVLAAGLGTRMRPASPTTPKPLIAVAGKALIDHVLDRLLAAGVETAVVNVHHRAEAIEAHLKARTRPRIAISDERAALLNTGGGIVKALPLLGKSPFLLMNSDTLWTDHAEPNLVGLERTFDPARMDALLLLAPRAGASGYEGRGDYAIDVDGRLRHRAERDTAPLVYTGAAVLAPQLFDGVPPGAFPLRLLFDRAERDRRLFGRLLDGAWMHVGTPEAIAAAEAILRARV